MHFQGSNPSGVTRIKMAQPGKENFTLRLEQQSAENREEAPTAMAWSTLAEHKLRPPVKIHSTANSASSLLLGSMAAARDVRGCSSSSPYLIELYLNVAWCSTHSLTPSHPQRWS